MQGSPGNVCASLLSACAVLVVTNTSDQQYPTVESPIRIEPDTVRNNEFSVRISMNKNWSLDSQSLGSDHSNRAICRVSSM